ncbi:MAG: tetratricopeptide repeat protein [Xenococcus sp. (in: cyanobacteria)]
MDIDYLERANQQFNNKNYQAALENYNLAIKHYPTLAEAYYNRGLVKRIICNHEEAIQDFSIAIILAPKMFLAYYYRGLTYYELGDYPYATANYNYAIMLNPKLARAYYQRAIICGELGRNAQAYEDFQKAATIAKSQKNTDLFKKAKKAQAQLKKLNQSNPLAGKVFFGLKILLLTLFLSAVIGQITSNFNFTNDSKIHQEENK